MDTWPFLEDASEEPKMGSLFENPFHIEDIMVFDDSTLHRLLASRGTELEVTRLAQSLHGVSDVIIKRIEYSLPTEQQAYFRTILLLPISDDQIRQAREYVLNVLFWDLTYWKTPQWYHELTEGELLHPSIFEQLEPDIHHHIVLDAAAGSGRATFECLRHGARLVYAVDPAPELLRILEHRLFDEGESERVILRQGSFDHLPLENDSVDLALSCSAFQPKEAQGGESGLAELWRVTKAGGKIVMIWPLPQDYHWFASHGFQYQSFPPLQEPMVRFRSRESALRCVKRFYAKRPESLRYLLEHEQPEIPYSILGFKQLSDYCWLVVEKGGSL
ncbi:hypothetical protein KSD_61710 [Ktedonobacter sp. SOSP1-85]|uniref:Methyltransferase type 11 domain-containing protein n=2 Tax=Ktedonobacter TaxID=363276 RepID=A0ABQ3UV88_9CHLR|nr:class I SAM-dependent methyltransferase [Ktedonobacter robiniae]GHO56711.1 hypothetical protein KSB_51860 [Ktedonobacter robiniae]GHO78400.1 hypothetical protein KSD_61710 [Ktedonobacter sp. SOSP1-85]